jgi:pimeloyl-ACP methyl ester carboxylesterase
MRRMANLLSEEGFAVLRFDYYGTGDSSGQSGEGNVAQWKDDIRTAYYELTDMAGTRSISIVGTRLGAALACQSAAEGLRIRDLVLWDPVVDGKKYMEELRCLHDTLQLNNQLGSLSSHEADWLLGYRFPAEMREGIGAINLLSLRPGECERLFLIVSEERPDYRALSDRLAEGSKRFEYDFVPDASLWSSNEDFDQALLVNEILRKVISLLAGKET